MSEIRALPDRTDRAIGANYTLTDIQKEQRIADTMLRTVAEGTGGIAMVDANQLTTALDRIVAESSHYYLLGYTPPNPKRDGKYRRDRHRAAQARAARHRAQGLRRAGRPRGQARALEGAAAGARHAAPAAAAGRRPAARRARGGVPGRAPTTSA